MEVAQNLTDNRTSGPHSVLACLHSCRFSFHYRSIVGDRLLASLFVAMLKKCEEGKARWECWLIWFYPCWKYSQHKRLVVWPWSNKLCMSKLLHIAVGSHWRQEMRSSQRGFIFISRTHSLQISGIIFMPINAILTQMGGIYEPNLALYVHWSFCLGK